MKSILSFSLSVCVFLIIAAPVYARGDLQVYREKMNTASHPAMKERLDEVKQKVREKIENRLQERLQKEMDRRTEALNKLTEKINKIDKLSPDKKSSLTHQVQMEKDNLTKLHAKILSETDSQKLETDKEYLINSHKQFALSMAKITIIASADRMIAVADQLSVLADKLQTRITEAQTNGKDVTSLQQLLTDMKTNIASAKKQATDAINAVTPLTSEDFPGNKSTLQEARKMLQTGHQDLKKARKDAHQIINGLREKKNAAPTPLLSPQVTP